LAGAARSGNKSEAKARIKRKTMLKKKREDCQDGWVTIQHNFKFWLYTTHLEFGRNDVLN